MKKYLLLVLLMISLPVVAEKTDVLKIYEAFTLTSAAAGKCIKPDKEELTSFLANYQMVTVSVQTELKKRKPELTKEQAGNIINVSGKKLTGAINTFIEKEGCENPKIQELIKRFHVLAKWKP